MPFETLRVLPAINQSKYIGTNPLILGPGSTRLPDSDDRLHSGLVESLLANTLPEGRRG